MTVRRAAVLGRCTGVRRAVELALETAAREGGEAFTLGPLIHNPQAVAELEAAGVRALGSTELDGRLKGKAVVVRAHGVPPSVRARLEELGARIVDATCPRVLASQRRAADFARRGYLVVIAGDEGHGEVVGIAGHAPGAIVIGSPEEARRVDPGSRPVALLAQTTISAEEFDAVSSALQERCPVLEIVRSICPCTSERLDALEALAGDVDAIVVVGGRNSANTARLLKAARGRGLPAWLVETAAELPAEAFARERVGLTAGASTPESLIDEVEAALLGGGTSKLYRQGSDV